MTELSIDTSNNGWQTAISKSEKRRQRQKQRQEQQRQRQENENSGNTPPIDISHLLSQNNILELNSNNKSTNEEKRGNKSLKKKKKTLDEISAEMLPSPPQPKPKKTKKSNKSNTTTEKRKKQSIKSLKFLLTLDKLRAAISKTQQRYPQKPDVQVEDLAGYFAEEFNDIEFKQGNLTFADFAEAPLCYTQDDVYNELVNFLEPIDFATIFSTFKLILRNLLTETAENSSSGVEIGLKLFIQFLIKTHPMEFLATTDLVKSLFSPSKSGRIRDMRSFKQYIWLVAQAAPVSPLDSLKEWGLEFFPILMQGKPKPEEKELIFNLAHFIVDQKIDPEKREEWKTSPIPCNTFVAIINRAFCSGDMMEEFKNLYPTLLPKSVLLNRWCKQENFKHFLSLLTSIQNYEPKEQVKKLLVFCLEEDSCFDVWQQVYRDNIDESRELIEFILEQDNWPFISIKVNRTKLTKTLDSLLNTNQDIIANNDAIDRQALQFVSDKMMQLRNRVGKGDLCKYAAGMIFALLLTIGFAFGALLFVDPK
eukprot:gb/GECH01013081.1/.p1 GENE.gb/GECH01013081.1/~~gb/GECH01013081.1/.p1  ORF type:complete len:535 (+),score=131.59 gb/GECH01013081.1/:1-1605(+)